MTQFQVKVVCKLLSENSQAWHRIYINQSNRSPVWKTHVTKSTSSQYFLIRNKTQVRKRRHEAMIITCSKKLLITEFSARPVTFKSHQDCLPSSFFFSLSSQFMLCFGLISQYSIVPLLTCKILQTSTLKKTNHQNKNQNQTFQKHCSTKTFPTRVSKVS